MRRCCLIAILLLLVLSDGGLLRPPAARAVGAWVPAASPDEVLAFSWRGSGVTTLLRDGRVLVTSWTLPGRDQPWRIAPTIYGPATDRWSARATALLEGGNSAPVLLPDGRVLFTGGSVPGPSPTSSRSLNTAQLYDPATDTWSQAAPFAITRAGKHTATLLQDGTVLIVGGLTNFRSTTVAEAERYDPRTNRWSPAGRLLTGRTEHTATPLRDGRVLIVGGRPDIVSYGAGAELYDPATSGWSATGAMLAPRGGAHSATLLADGTVLIVGGYTGRAGASGAVEPQAAAERYDPATERWIAAPPLSSPRNAHSATLLPNGWVLVAGGYAAWPSSQSLPSGLASSELYDPARGIWAGAASLPDRRTGHDSARLADGRVLILGGFGTPSAVLYTPEPHPSACFAETGQCVAGRFLEYWLTNGGLARNGFPFSPVRLEILEDGRAYQVQYFERVRLEYHPENAPPYDILLGQFGRRIGAVEPPRPSRVAEGGFAYFAETGHNVPERFFRYWEANGGLAQFGYPLTEEYDTPPGTTPARSVQYFERARFEYHPENAGTAYEVLLGQLGRTILAQSALLGGEIGALYLTTPAVREGLGLALAGATEAPGAAQAFERGLMLSTSQPLAPAGARPIFVLQGDRQMGQLLADPPRPYFPDTWAEGQDPGGGPAPAAGLYLPRRGFGKVWRDNPDVQRQLGYATTATEAAAPLTLQEFERGVILAVSRPDGRCLYAVTYNATAKGVDGGTYRCYAPPAR